MGEGCLANGRGCLFTVCNFWGMVGGVKLCDDFFQWCVR